MRPGFRRAGADSGAGRRLAREFRVVVFDNRGAGKSTARLRLFGIGDLADDAAAALGAAGTGTAFVFGISMGGMIALELVLRHRRRRKRRPHRRLPRAQS